MVFFFFFPLLSGPLRTYQNSLYKSNLHLTGYLYSHTWGSLTWVLLASVSFTLRHLIRKSSFRWKWNCNLSKKLVTVTSSWSVPLSGSAWLGHTQPWVRGWRVNEEPDQKSMFCLTGESEIYPEGRRVLLKCFIIIIIIIKSREWYNQIYIFGLSLWLQYKK